MQEQILDSRDPSTKAMITLELITKDHVTVEAELKLDELHPENGRKDCVAIVRTYLQPGPKYLNLAVSVPHRFAFQH